MKFIYMLTSGLSINIVDFILTSTSSNIGMEFDFFFFSWKLHKNYPQLQLFIKNIPNQSLNFVWHKLSIKSVDSFPQNTITRIIFTAINMVLSVKK